MADFLLVNRCYSDQFISTVSAEFGGRKGNVTPIVSYRAIYTATKLFEEYKAQSSSNRAKRKESI